MTRHNYMYYMIMNTIFWQLMQFKYHLNDIVNHLYEVPVIFFPQLFRSQPFLETEKAMIMGKTVSSTADILCCLSDPGIEKPVVCMCDVSIHTYVKYTYIYTYNF